MNYGQGNKLQDEINPAGKNNRYFSKENFEMLFWVTLIIGFLTLFINNKIFIYYFGGSIIFFILSKINWQSKYLSWLEDFLGVIYFIFFILIFLLPIIFYLIKSL